MSRRRVHSILRIRLLVGLILLLVAAEPLIHTHPLIAQSHGADSGASSVCAACVVASAQIITALPAMALPAIVVGQVVIPALHFVSADTLHTLPSRAPPAIQSCAF